MVILLAAMLALPGKPGHALLELEKDVDRAEAILASGHGSLERAAQLETSTDDMAAEVMIKLCEPEGDAALDGLQTILRYYKENTDFKFDGLEYKIKSKGSLAGKLPRKMGAAHASASFEAKVGEVLKFGDVVRYTVLVYDDTQYVDIITAVRDGVTISKAKNYWHAGNCYKGVNDVYLTPALDETTVRERLADIWWLAEASDGVKPTLDELVGFVMGGQDSITIGYEVQYQTVSSAHAKHLAHIAYDIYRVPDGDFADPGLVASIKASLGVAMQMCYRVLPAASAGVVGVPDPPGVGTLGEPKSNQPSGLYAIGDEIPTVEDWGTWVKDENIFASKLQELETKAAVAGGVAHDELDVFWAAEGGLTEEDDEVFSDLDYDGGA